MNLTQWAARHGVTHQALSELRSMMGVNGVTDADNFGMSEAGVQSRIRLEAAKKGCYLWRNNVGVLPDRNGRPIRYGLANDSKAVNKAVKSGDLIGVRPVLITQNHIGHTIGQFLSREAKPGSWRYSGTDREVAQLAWAELITSLGGDACFANNEGTI